MTTENYVKPKTNKIQINCSTRDGLYYRFIAQRISWGNNYNENVVYFNLAYDKYYAEFIDNINDNKEFHYLQSVKTFFRLTILDDFKLVLHEKHPELNSFTIMLKIVKENYI